MLLPEDVLGGQGAQLADAEAGVEKGPDDELFGGVSPALARRPASRALRGSRTCWYGIAHP